MRLTWVNAGIHRRGALALGRHCRVGRAKHRAANIVGEDSTAELSSQSAIGGKGRCRTYESKGVKVEYGKKRIQEA